MQCSRETSNRGTCKLGPGAPLGGILSTHGVPTGGTLSTARPGHGEPEQVVASQGLGDKWPSPVPRRGDCCELWSLVVHLGLPCPSPLFLLVGVPRAGGDSLSPLPRGGVGVLQELSGVPLPGSPQPSFPALPVASCLQPGVRAGPGVLPNAPVSLLQPTPASL